MISKVSVRLTTSQLQSLATTRILGFERSSEVRCSQGWDRALRIVELLQIVVQLDQIDITQFSSFRWFATPNQNEPGIQIEYLRDLLSMDHSFIARSAYSHPGALDSKCSSVRPLRKNVIFAKGTSVSDHTFSSGSWDDLNCHLRLSWDGISRKSAMDLSPSYILWGALKFVFTCKWSNIIEEQ